MTGPASFERPSGATVELELVGAVPADPHRVFALLAARLDPQGDAPFAADPVTGRIVLQGDYWYRGEYEVTPDEGGARVAHTIVNVSPGWQLLGRLTGRRVLRGAPREFSRLLAEVEAALR